MEIVLFFNFLVVITMFHEIVLILFYQDKRKATPAKASDTKRTRRDRRELENIIFKLFEKQPNWALKQLVIETDQPEVCSLNSKVTNLVAVKG